MAPRNLFFNFFPLDLDKLPSVPEVVRNPGLPPTDHYPGEKADFLVTLANNSAKGLFRAKEFHIAELTVYDLLCRIIHRRKTRRRQRARFDKLPVQVKDADWGEQLPTADSIKHDWRRPTITVTVELPKGPDLFGRQAKVDIFGTA